MEVSWLSFLNYKHMAKWLLDSRAGVRFVRWFVRRHHKELMASEVGSALYDWVRLVVIAEQEAVMAESRKQMVVETHPDGFIRVYGSDGVSVSFVHRLEVQSAAAEVVDEERCWLGCSWSQRKVYLERVIACDNPNLYPRSIGELLEKEAKGKLNDALDRRRRAADRPGDEVA